MDAAVRAYQSVTQKAVRDRLITDHVDCVRHVLARLVPGLPPFIDTDNLEAAGLLGLVEAAANFESDRGVEFRTFAYHRIRGAILDELRCNCPLPQRVLQQWSQIRQAWDALGEAATPATVADKCGLQESEVEDCLAAIRLTQPEEWREELSQVSRHRIHDGDQAQQLERADEQRLLADAIEQLPERLRLVLSLYFLEELRLAEIGQVLELSESRVSRLLAQAQLQLRAILQNRMHSPPGHGPHFDVKASLSKEFQS
jgi:RNA polymerase sigma factor for flagellar operon FliA